MGRTGSWLPTACTMGKMMMAPTVWEMKVVAPSTSAQNTAATPHSPRSPTYNPCGFHAVLDNWRISGLLLGV